VRPQQWEQRIANPEHSGGMWVVIAVGLAVIVGMLLASVP
jgi:hypothetical protein